MEGLSVQWWGKGQGAPLWRISWEKVSTDLRKD